MNIDLAKKNFIDLKKVASEIVELKGLGCQKAKVALALDISGSMSGLFANGTVQKVVEELLALAVKFDDNKAIDIFLFGQNDYEVGELHEDDFYEYVNNKIVPKYRLEGSTNYGGVMKRIINRFGNGGGKKKGIFNKLFSTNVSEPMSEPVLVIFVTDGDNYDKPETENIIREAANQGIFWQFVGLGDSSFGFLQKLDELGGRFIDNADFFQLNDINNISERELYSRLLNEFPQWITDARKENLIK